MKSFFHVIPVSHVIPANAGILMLVFLGLFCSSFGFATEPQAPRLLEVGVSDVFVPQGFDDNDNAQVVVEGIFPTTCYKLGPVKVDINEDTIKITPQAYFYHGPCLQVMVPYKQEINLGILKAGTYKLNILPDCPENRHTLSIAHSTNSGPDDYLYAPIESARVVSKERPTVRLHGVFSNSCMSLDRVVTHSESNRVVAILPIAKYENNGACLDVLTPFHKDVQIKDPLKGRTLLHVRSLNGTAVNVIEDF
ncbi:MAG: hypothetical protein HYW85_04075 [Deltaproteobacteria bacterium]|nr:hypothetical protein [Deltaproteobacteria bacterium]MBI3016754.1 hypothetical protein [Deltaproteobacteria bacterium]